MTAVLLFDGACPFCSTCARLMRRWVRPDCVVVPFQRVDLRGWHLTQAQVADEVVFASRRGDFVLAETGVDAIAAALAIGRTPWPIVGRLVRTPGAHRPAGILYRLVNQHRYRLPGGTPACDLDGVAAVVGAG